MSPCSSAVISLLYWRTAVPQLRSSLHTEYSWTVFVCSFRLPLPRVRERCSCVPSGRHYRVLVNGVRVFLRGSNWVPSHVLPEQATEAYTRRLLQDAILANQNTLRVWGGGIYESDYFYQVTHAGRSKPAVWVIIRSLKLRGLRRNSMYSNYLCSQLLILQLVFLTHITYIIFIIIIIII